MHKTLSVEFFGMPGVGKSVLSGKVAQILSTNEIPVEQTAYLMSHQMSRFKRAFIKLLHVIKELLLHPRYAFLSIKTILQTQQKTPLDLIKVIFNWLFVSSLIRNKRYYNGVSLFDEGIFQALWSIGISGKDGTLRIMSPLFSTMPIPNIVVVPQASFATVKSRMDGRERHDSRLEKESTELLEFAGYLFSEIKAILQSLREEHNDLHVYIVDNDFTEDLEINAKKITSEIKRFLNA